jgi:hypothetical protein
LYDGNINGGGCSARSSTSEFVTTNFNGSFDGAGGLICDSRLLMSLELVVVLEALQMTLGVEVFLMEERPLVQHYL